MVREFIQPREGDPVRWMFALMCLVVPTLANGATITIPCTPNDPAKAFAIGQTAQPGDHVIFQACTYQHRPARVSSTLFHITTTGVHYQAEKDPSSTHYRPVILRGQGYSDADRGDGKALGVPGCPRPGPNGCQNNEALIQVDGSGNTVEGFILEESSRWHIRIYGTDQTVIQNTSRGSWHTGIELRGTGHIIRHNEIAFARHHTGLEAWHPFSRVTIEENLVYASGYESWNVRVLPIDGDPGGGGNSDNFGAFKDCSINAQTNECLDSVWARNISMNGADGGYDFSSGRGLMLDNLSLGDGSVAGGTGWKFFQPAPGNDIIGNLAYRAYGRGFEIRGTDGVHANNTAIHSREHNFVYQSNPSVKTFRNNLGWESRQKDFNLVPCGDCPANMAGDGTAPASITGDPKVVNDKLWWNQALEGMTDRQNSKIYNHLIDVSALLPSGTPHTRWQWVWEQVHTNLALKQGSSAIDTGSLVTYRHPISGQTITRPHRGSKPDIHFQEFAGSGPPPVPTVKPPGAPTDLELFARGTSDDLNMIVARGRWTAPTVDIDGNPVEPITGYTVCVAAQPIPEDKGGARCSSEADTQTDLLECPEGHMCYWRVSAHTAGGEGPLSAPRSITIPEDYSISR